MRHPRPQIRSGIAQVVLCRLRRASANLACRVRPVMPIALPWCATIALMMASCVRLGWHAAGRLAQQQRQ